MAILVKMLIEASLREEQPGDEHGNQTTKDISDATASELLPDQSFRVCRFAGS